MEFEKLAEAVDIAVKEMEKLEPEAKKRRGKSRRLSRTSINRVSPPS